MALSDEVLTESAKESPGAWEEASVVSKSSANPGPGGHGSPWKVVGFWIDFESGAHRIA